jgi:hypothetical protein
MKLDTFFKSVLTFTLLVPFVWMRVTQRLAGFAPASRKGRLAFRGVNKRRVSFLPEMRRSIRRYTWRGMMSKKK